MITIKIRRKNGKEHTFNVYKVITTPVTDCIVMFHPGIDSTLKFNKWAIGVDDTVFYNNTSFKINTVEDIQTFRKILIELKDK